MLNRPQAVLGFLLATAIWAVVLVLQSEPSAYYQICETNQYTEHKNCAAHHVLYVAFWYIGYVFNPTTITACATIAIAWFTWTLKRSTDNLWRAGTDQFRLSRDEFNATHRPRMRLKHIWFTTDILNGDPIEVVLDIVNFGDAPGLITNFNYDTLVLPSAGASLPQRPTYNETNPRITFQFRDQIRLPSGITYTRAVSDGRILAAWEIMGLRRGALRLYFIGSIEYWDAAGLKQTAWCRYLRFDNYPPGPTDRGRFEIYEDSNYEYQD